MTDQEIKEAEVFEQEIDQEQAETVAGGGGVANGDPTLTLPKCGRPYIDRIKGPFHKQ